MLAHRLRRCNNAQALVQCLVFAGFILCEMVGELAYDAHLAQNAHPPLSQNNSTHVRVF